MGMQTASSIWFIKPTLEVANGISRSNTIAEVLDIRVTEIGDASVTGTMPVDARTHQPMGILHGGASVVLAESLGSLAANFCINHQTHYCVGLDINANHIRAVRSGMVTGIAEPVHLGRTTQVWGIRVLDEQDRLVCVSRLTMAVLAHPTERTSPQPFVPVNRA
jgi:1,4-dihydroxy-2-naphthoyl-CoA hydrolase